MALETGLRRIWKQLKGTQEAPGYCRPPCVWSEALWRPIVGMYRYWILHLVARIGGEIPATQGQSRPQRARLGLRVHSFFALMLFTGPIFLSVSACLVALACALWVGPVAAYALLRSLLWDGPRAFFQQHCPLRWRYQPTSMSTMGRWQCAGRFAIWLFVGLLVGAGVAMGLYWGGAPVLLLGSLLTYALVMGGASALATVGACMYMDAVRDQPSESHASRSLYYLRLLISGWLMAPLMALGGVMAPVAVAGSKLFGAVSLLVGSGAPFMTQWAVFMGLIMGAVFVIQSMSMGLIGLARYMRVRYAWVGQDHDHWTYKCEESLRVSAKVISGVLMLALCLVTLNVIPVFEAGLGAFFKTEWGVRIWQISAGLGAALSAYGLWFFATDGLKALWYNRTKSKRAGKLDSSSGSNFVDSTNNSNAASDATAAQITGQLAVDPKSPDGVSAAASESTQLTAAAREKIETIVKQMLGDRFYQLENTLEGASDTQSIINTASMTQKIIDFYQSGTDEAMESLKSFNEHSDPSADECFSKYANQMVRYWVIEAFKDWRNAPKLKELGKHFPCVKIQGRLERRFCDEVDQVIMPHLVKQWRPDIHADRVSAAVRALTHVEVSDSTSDHPRESVLSPQYAALRQTYILPRMYKQYDAYWQDARAQVTKKEERANCVKSYMFRQPDVNEPSEKKVLGKSLNDVINAMGDIVVDDSDDSDKPTFKDWALAKLNEQFPRPPASEGPPSSDDDPSLEEPVDSHNDGPPQSPP